MIKFSEIVPSVYPNTSRDFQYLSRLVDIVLNSVKHNVDAMYDLPNTKANPKIAELLATTLGFKVKRNYDTAQLSALASVIPLVMRHKGSLEAIRLAGTALLRATSVSGTFDCSVENNCVRVVFPKSLADTTLFMDLLPYILPAGMTCKIAHTTQAKDTLTPINIKYDDQLRAVNASVLTWNDEEQYSTGLATIFTGDLHNDQRPSVSTNIIYNRDGEPIENNDELLANTGLLSNSIIPDLTIPLKNTMLKDEEN